MLPDYFIFHLTGRCVSDVRTAESTALFDRRAGRWIEPLLTHCGLRVDMMPKVGQPGDRAGELQPRPTAEIGLPPSIAVAVGAMDQLAGALGTGNVTPGWASVSLGTALAVVVTADHEPATPGGISLRPHPVPGLCALLAYAKTGGVVLRWFCDNFAPAWTYEDLFAQAASAPVGCNGVTCLPHFSGTATPSFNPAARGAFFGLALHHRRSHLARAVVESLCFTIRENLDLLGTAAPVELLRATGGGAVSDVWLQMIADATGLCVERSAQPEAACFGAAQLAMKAAGAAHSIADVASALYKPDRRFLADDSSRAAYEEAFGRYRALRRKLYEE
jgi:xylulokinase